MTATAGDIPAPPDNTAPDTTIEAEIDGLMATFMLSSSEEGSTFECSLDGAPFAECTSPYVMTDLEPGTHVFWAQGNRHSREHRPELRVAHVDGGGACELW